MQKNKKSNNFNTTENCNFEIQESQNSSQFHESHIATERELSDELPEEFSDDLIDDLASELTSEIIDDLLPRYTRKPRRPSCDRGLPPDTELKALATTYLKCQRELWPKITKTGLIPEPTDDIIDRMVTDYKERHRTGKVNLEDDLQLYSTSATLFGLIYARYSCDRSSPTSILDQVVNCLEEAKEEGRFVPWEFISADYARSGRDSHRLGYTNSKEIIPKAGNKIDTLYIDDFTRASRDELEWWKLAALCKREKMRMIGASDDFDLSKSDWDMKVTIFGLVSRLFLRGLREKVIRGMKGAARRGTVLGKLPLGFTRQVTRDEEGNIIQRQNGKPLHKIAIDSETQKHVLLIFKLFVVSKWSAYRIAKHFNHQKIDSTDTWTESSIKKILLNRAFMGKFIWNRYRREFDYDQDKWVKLLNPRSEWVVYYNPLLRLISVKLWRDAQKIIRKNKKKGNNTSPSSRNQRSATTLLSGTLHCSYCGKELTLSRSAGKYKSMFCMNGRTGVRGCRLSTNKSTRIIENSILSFLNESILTESVVEDLVTQANSHLETLAKQPTIDVKPLRSEIAKYQKKIDRLVKLIEDLSEDELDLLEGYKRRIVQLQKEVNQLRESLREAQKTNVTPPPPLSLEMVKSYLPDLREILNQEIPQSADAIRQLTGPITIKQEKIEGQKNGARWIATFTPDLPFFLSSVAQAKNYPDSMTLEFLSHGNWITPECTYVVIEELQTYERIADDAANLIEKGASIETIARNLKSSWATVQEALEFKQTGKRPAAKPTGKKTRKRNGPPKHQVISEDVAHRRDDKKETFAKIARDLNVSEGTVTRAYDYAHRELLETAASNGKTPIRGRWRHISADTIAEVHRLLKEAKLTFSEIARQVGVSPQTVRRERDKLNSK